MPTAQVTSARGDQKLGQKLIFRIHQKSFPSQLQPLYAIGETRTSALYAIIIYSPTKAKEYVLTVTRTSRLHEISDFMRLLSIGERQSTFQNFLHLDKQISTCKYSTLTSNCLLNPIDHPAHYLTFADLVQVFAETQVWNRPRK